MDSLLVASPYLQDPLDFQSSSPRLNQFDTSPSDAPYDSFDYTQESSHFPHTPSYNGSYQNTPFSNFSDLPVFDGDTLGLYPNELSAPAIPDEYDPSEYDLPSSSGNNILSFDNSFMPSLDNNTNPHVSVTPPVYDNNSSNAFDHSSPASSNGQEDGRRSRASSTSSYMHPSSPHLDLPQNLASLHFDSPAWPAGQLPDRPSPPQHKPPSPPQLVIPASPSTAHNSPPTINAPEGDGMGSGPQLHIVPATPVSGGGGTAANVPFQTTLANLQQGGSGNEWDPSRQHLTAQAQNQSLQSSQFTDQRAFHFPPGSDHNEQSSSGMAFASSESQMHQEFRRQHHSMSPMPQQQHSQSQQHHYLVPQMSQRSRSLSDTSTRPPVWDTMPTGMMPPNATAPHQGSGADFDGNIASHSHDGGRGASVVGTVNMNDVLPGPSSTASNSNPTATSLHSPPSAGLPRHPSSAGPLQSSFGHPLQLPHTLQHHSFGPGSSHLTATNSSDFLSPHDAAGATLLRRSKSDSQQRGHRLSRSEDFGGVNSNNFLRADNAMLYPPISVSSRQYLHPTESVPSIASRGHHRRSSSGSRERGLVGGWSSNASSARPSPYPSPSASPRPGYHPLPEMVPSITGPSARRHMTGMSLDMGMNLHNMNQGYGGGMGGVGGMNGMNSFGMPGGHVPGMSGVGGMSVPVSTGDAVVPMIVNKANVTTPSTADASKRRRKQPANFACPVPGCGSTFTRHFNLKGHLRSHAEEKPYQCKWPGCGKGFARQHDCKRHEQLHLNIRPYPCEGCKKNFARMDALNRHLRSEGGAECRKIQEEMTTSSGTESATDASAAPGASATSNGQNGDTASNATMKPDPDGNWAAMNGAIVM